jgi:hypothetical protein
MKLLAILFFVGLIIIFGPFLTIWALNTLFPVLAIPFTLETWFASIILSGGFLFRSAK